MQKLSFVSMVAGHISEHTPLEFRNVGFCGGRKTGVPGEKPSEQGREPTTNSTQV